MIETAGDLIALAFKTAGIVGVGQVASATDANDALSLLAMMVAQWQRKRWLVWDLVETVLVSTGAPSYSIGPGMAFNVARPARISDAFARILTSAGPNQVDMKLSIIEAREDYIAISVKNLVSMPVALFYDSAWPDGTLYFWPVPPAGAYELHINTVNLLPVYATLSAPLNLPPEYTEALLYSLAVRLAMNYGMEPRPSLVAAMRQALNTIRMANAQVATLGIPDSLGGQGSGIAASADPAFQSGQW